MWNCDRSWIDLDREDLEHIRWNLKPRVRNDFLDASTYIANYITDGEKEDTEHMSVQKGLSKAIENTKKEIVKEWTRGYVHSFCSVKSIEVSADHKTVVVIWTDGSVTIVKRSEKDPDDIYMAFTAALAKKLYGSNSAIKRTISKKINEHMPKIKKEKIE